MVLARTILERTPDPDVRRALACAALGLRGAPYFLREVDVLTKPDDVTPWLLG